MTGHATVAPMSDAGPATNVMEVRPIVAGIRFGAVVLAFGLCAILGQFDELALPLILLALLAIAATVPAPPAIRRYRPLAEATAAAALIGLTSTPDALLPYLVVPPLAAGVEAGVILMLGSVAIQAIVLVLSGIATSEITEPQSVITVAEWAALGLATGAVGAWARRQIVAEESSTDTYVAAHTLLSQLREVARALPTGLDEVSLGQSVLDSVKKHTPFDRAVIYSLNDLDILIPLTVVGAERLDWDLDGKRGLWAKVQRTRDLEVTEGSFSDPTSGASAVLPLRLGAQLIGAAAIERDGAVWARESLDAAQEVMDDAAIRLDTGRLFTEVRALATMEERRRLAREIHDGIAQEVASLGYVVDELAADEQNPEQRKRIVQLRGELSRLVSELRLSIFDLRSDVEPSTGLGATLSSYVRQVGTTSGLTIHLVLDESSQRLPADTETELLRIAQEAVTNARRHSRARNLWVTCRVNPPNAFLRVADDGQGLGSPRIDSYGLDIMRERAGRLGVQLSVRERVGGGTVVEVALGSAAIGSSRGAQRKPRNRALE